MINSILIANRGEIACRIARTCRALGIRTVAVYSDADRDALHVAVCDEARRLGPAPARESYLDGDRILAAAHASGADAIHPGYGFLSENPDFADACTAAGIIFIGPTADAIRAMGSKRTAKAIMGEAGVPLVPGYHGADQDDTTLAKAADAIGYPVLIKASAGGGGKGMRRVDRREDFADQAAGARREASAAFGDDALLVEKYLVEPRHVEVQIFADTHGNAVHLFERDCSVQRRHQKVVEEAPAPGLDPATRETMGAAAIAAARAIDYVGAGTVEFIMDAGGAFYFMEMNTRLQVEHPVTEMVTGLDLVEWQIRVAAGEPLPRAQEAISMAGHALEVRIYAEDPTRDFLPATGTIHALHEPTAGRHVRVDSGVRSGDAVSVHYDPMLAKLVAWGHDRSSALVQLRRALAEWLVVGVTTNSRFLAAVAAHPAFDTGGVDTGFIERHAEELLRQPESVPDRTLAVAALHQLLGAQEHARAMARASGDPWSPWQSTAGWQPNTRAARTLHFLYGERELTVSVRQEEERFFLELPGGSVTARAERDAGGQLIVELGDVQLPARTVAVGHRLTVAVDGVVRELVVHDPLAPRSDDYRSGGGLTAPMPGRVLELLVEPDQAVAEGQALLILEAMKMEHTIRAGRAGRVAAIHYRAGDAVEDGAELLTLVDDS